MLRRQGRGGGNKFRPLNRPLRLGGSHAAQGLPPQVAPKRRLLAPQAVPLSHEEALTTRSLYPSSECRQL
ncbi:MAG: hypothetical protein AAGE84_02710 [Cyanobacteria bacterium P01_G01_bin.39]